MGSAHRAPIVDSTLSGCSVLSQTGLAHHTSDIFNIQLTVHLIYSIFSSQYQILNIEYQPSLNLNFLSIRPFFHLSRILPEVQTKWAKLSLEHSQRPQTAPFTWPQRHTPIRLEAHPLSNPPSHTLHTWFAQHTSCYVLIAYWFLEAQEKAPQQTKYDSLMKSE